MRAPSDFHIWYITIAISMTDREQMIVDINRIKHKHTLAIFPKMFSKMSEKKEKIFICSFCGARIKTNKANLRRHEKIHGRKIQKIKCAVNACAVTFQQKSDYYSHWKKFHDAIVMPDGFQYVTEDTKKYRRKFRQNIETSSDSIRPIDFFLLNSLGLMEKEGLNVKLVKLQADPFFGQLSFSDS